MEEGQVQRWFALRVKSRCEKAVAAAARQKGYEDFVPLYLSRQRWSDRQQMVALPLFPGYVFCRLNPEHRMPLLTIPGVLDFVEVGRVPVPIDDAEIASIQIAVRSQLKPQPCEFPPDSSRVRLDNGPLSGLVAYRHLTTSSNKVIVPLTVLKRYISVDVEDNWVCTLL
jgi:transcription antitermination factor NusG